MVARPIHRFGTADRFFHGASAAASDALRPGMAALFGLSGEVSRGLRDASWTLPPVQHLADLGDVAGPALVPAAAASILDRGAWPVFCADETGVAVAMIHAVLDRAGPGVGAVLISARLEPFLAAGLRLAIGAHDLLPARAVSRWMEAGGAIVTADAVEAEGTASVKAVLDRLGLRRGVVLLDLGVIDTGHAAGALALNVGGLTPAGFGAVLAALRTGLDIAALAVCGLAPERDPRGHSERLAAGAVAALAAGAAPA